MLDLVGNDGALAHTSFYSFYNVLNTICIIYALFHRYFPEIMNIFSELNIFAEIMLIFAGIMNIFPEIMHIFKEIIDL